MTKKMKYIAPAIICVAIDSTLILSASQDNDVIVGKGGGSSDVTPPKEADSKSMNFIDYDPWQE